MSTTASTGTSMLAALSAVAATALQLPSAHPYQWTASASSSATSRAPLARVTAARCVYCASSQHDQSPQSVAAQTSTTLPIIAHTASSTATAHECGGSSILAG